MKTTLNAIRKHSPCISGWNTLLKGLNKTSADDEPLDLMDILKHIEIQDSIWCLRVFEYRDYCLFLADVAESVLPLFEDKYPNDKRPRDAIRAVRMYHVGEINKEQLQDDAAYAAANATATAYATANAAANDAATYAAYAAGDAAYAAYAAAHGATYAAYAAATAYATAYATANDAATYDAYAAYAAAYGAAYGAYADATYDATYAAYDARAQKWQEIEQLFIKHFKEA